jgi:hypothetical protein
MSSSATRTLLLLAFTTLVSVLPVPARADLASADALLDLVKCHRLNTCKSPLPENLAPSSLRATPRGDFSPVIQRALDLVAWSQINTSSSFFPPFSIQKLQDAYPSYVGFNLVGGPEEQALRHLMQIFDSNGFVTDWVVQMLVEAQRYGGVVLDDSTIARGVNFTLGFKEQNDPSSDGTMDFWREIDVNGTWQQFPENVELPIEMLEPIAALMQTWCTDKPAVCPYVQPIISLAANLVDYLSAFGIPADFDDSGVNLALGGLLSSVQGSLPSSWNLWITSPQNPDPASLMETYVRYAYRPFSADADQNSIDPRTYYYLRAFLELEKQRARERGEQPSLMLITTWSSNITESNREYYGQHKMPFQANNVDGSVVGNSLCGILTSILQHAPADGTGTYAKFISADLLQLIQDSARLLAWIVESEILLTRNDIVLLYYPPTFDFFLFAARSLHLLQSSDLTVFTQVYNDPTTHAALVDIQTNLAAALLQQGTATLTQKAQTGVSPNTSLPTAWYDDFLGNADVNAQNESTPHYDDRLFSTAIATLALTAAWTVDTDGPFAPTSALEWLPNVTSTTQALITSACQFLSEELTSGAYRPLNSFFSGSVKGPTTLPFVYPINSFLFVNGTRIARENITWDAIEPDLGITMSGVVTEEEYQSMMQNNPLQVPTPTVFRGYNEDAVGMVFWSSPPLTYAAGLLALTNCQALPSVPTRLDSNHGLRTSETIAEM